MLVRVLLLAVLWIVFNFLILKKNFKCLTSILFLQVWAIPCIKNSGGNLNLRRGDAVLVILVVLALVRHLILRLYVYAENKLFGSDKNMVIWKLASFLAVLICLVTKLLVTSSLARSSRGVRPAQKKHVTFKYTW